MAIWLARLSVERWRLSNGLEPGEGADSGPLALIAETAHGPRLEAVNAAAREAGLHSAMMLADARTLCPELAVEPADPAGDLDMLEKLALWARQWGPWSATDPPDGVLVDVTAVAHLFGGEERLLEDVSGRFAVRGLTARAAIAPTAGAAWALAHYGPHHALLKAEDDLGARLADLPVAALRLDSDVLTVLRRLGLKQLGDLNRIESERHASGGGRDALQRRFRNRKSPASNPLVRMDQLLGRVPEPLVPIVPQDIPLVQRRLMEPLRHRSLLDQVLGDLARDMARLLEGRGVGARRLDLGLWRVDGEVIIRQLELAAPTRDPAHITRLFAEKLERIEAGFGIEIVRLRASWAEPLALEQAAISDESENSSPLGTSLSAFIDRLTARLGPRAVSRPAHYPSHLPERAWVSVPPLEMDSGHPIVRSRNFRRRPIKLFDKAEKISVLYAAPDGFPQRFRWRGGVHDVARVEGPERVAPEWWRERSTARLRDYYRIENANGQRYWIYRHGLLDDGRGGAPDWYLQGVFS
jgi:protein ImuB